MNRRTFFQFLGAAAACAVCLPGETSYALAKKKKKKKARARRHLHRQKKRLHKLTGVRVPITQLVR